jgi:DNA end-binding protein Ku
MRDLRRRDREGALLLRLSRNGRETLMAPRAIWKGIINVGSAKVGVKLFSAVQDRTVHFRLLHKTDHEPVKQKLITQGEEEEVPTAEAKKAYQIARDRFIVIEDEDLEEIEPKESRDITIERFVARKEMDPRWYERAYWLAPDENKGGYFALAAALEKKERIGITRWVMRKKDYLGALVPEEGYLMLVVLRYADEIIAADDLHKPAGRDLSEREVKMGEQLIAMLEGEFNPDEWKDEYRARVLELVEAKAKGKRPKVEKFKPRKTDEDSLASALEASLAGSGTGTKRRAASGRR